MNLSLSSLIRQVDSRESYLDCALKCYRSALANLSAHLIVSDPQLKRQISNRLERLALSISRKSDPDTLGSTEVRLHEILIEYRTEEEAVYEQEQLQLRRTIMALEGLVSALSKQESEQNANLNDILQGLEAALFEGDLTSIHQTVQHQIRKLRTCLITLSEDRQARDAEVNARLSELRDNSARAARDEPHQHPKEHSTFESTLSRYMSTYTLFSVLLVRVEELGSFAKHWSSTCRTQVLLALQNRLSDCVGTLDRVHPLTEGQFLVVMRCSLVRALERAAHIRSIINSPYRVEVPFGTAEIELNSAIGGVEYIPGEDVVSLKTRAEQATFGGRSPSEADLPVELQWAF